MIDIAVLAAMGLAAGLFLLWWGGDRTVSYAGQVAYLFGLSGFFIGFFLISVSTGIPEISIAIASLLRGAAGLSLGDIVGSNLTDVSLVLGIPATFIGAIKVAAAEKKNILLSLGITGLLMAFVFSSPLISRWHGGVLITFYLASMAYFWRTRHGVEVAEDQEAISRRDVLEEEYLVTKAGSILKLLGSMVVVLFSAQLSVQSVLVLAEKFALSFEAIGATILAIGTSLPELTLTIMAARRREHSLALGNSLGSVLGQGGMVLGGLALASSQPLVVAPVRHIIPFMLLSYAIVAHAIWRRDRINLIEGLLLLGVYISFFLYEIRGFLQ